MGRSFFEGSIKTRKKYQNEIVCTTFVTRCSMPEAKKRESDGQKNKNVLRTKKLKQKKPLKHPNRKTQVNLALKSDLSQLVEPAMVEETNGFHVSTVKSHPKSLTNHKPDSTNAWQTTDTVMMLSDVVTGNETVAWITQVAKKKKIACLLVTIYSTNMLISQCTLQCAKIKNKYLIEKKSFNCFTNQFLNTFT